MSAAKGVLLGAGVFCVAILLYWLASYGTSVFRAGPPVIPVAVAATGFLFLLRMRSSLQVIVATLLLSVVSFLYTAEIVVYRQNAGYGTPTTPFYGIESMPQQQKDEIVALAKAAGTAMDTRTLAELLDNLHAKGVPSVPAVMMGGLIERRGPDAVLTSRAIPGVEQVSSVSPTVVDNSARAIDILPLGGISKVPTVLCNQEGSYVTYQSDEHGFRNPTGIWNAPRADMAAVGQSFVQGYCVPDGKLFVDLLRQRYPTTLNLGMSGDGPILQLAAIREYLPRYSPKVVLWLHAEGIDFSDLHAETRRPWLMQYLEPTFTQQLASRQTEVDATLRRFVLPKEEPPSKPRPSADPSIRTRLAGFAKLWNLRKQLDVAYGIKTAEDPAWETLTSEHNPLGKILSAARTETGRWGGTVYFVYLPSWSRYRNGAIGPDREREKVLAIARAVNMPVIDLTPAFDAHEDPLTLFPFRRFGHYNEEGNRIVADTVLKTVAPGDLRIASRKGQVSANAAKFQ